MKLAQYFNQASSAAKSEDGEKLSRLLRYADSHASSVADELGGDSEIERLSRAKVPPIWEEVVASHLKVVKNLATRGDVMGAAEEQNLLVQTFGNKLFISLGRRSLPAAYTVCRDLEQLSAEADTELAEQGKKLKYMEEAARTINGIFGKCLNDRSPLEKTRRWGTYRLITLLFRIYFRLGNMHLCVSLTKALKMQSELPALEKFPIAHQVTYRYYIGVLAFFDENYGVAEGHLGFAFERCHFRARKNKQLILLYLLPTRLLHGSLPEPWLLKRYQSINNIYGGLVSALRVGDLKSFDEELARHEMDLVGRGTYLTVERCRFLCIRNLFRKVYLLSSTPTRLPLSTFQSALRLCNYPQADDPLDVECVLANMIEKGYMKGYLSHERGIAVLAKEGAFPPIEGGELRS